MKELINKILTYLPQFLTDFIGVFSAPKTWIARKNADADGSFVDSLIFLTISEALVMVMASPLQPPGFDIWSSLAASSVATMIVILAFAAALRLSWRVVGGKASFISFFVTYAYFTGVLMIVSATFFLLSEGVCKALDPVLYTQMREAQWKGRQLPEVSDSILPLVSLGIIITGFVFILVWGFIAWGAYRELNGLSRTRSFFALLLVGPFGWGIAGIAYFIGTAIH